MSCYTSRRCSTAELFGMCCSRRLNVVELNPNNEDDSYGAFAKSDIVLALRGHPGYVQDLCRCPLVHEERGLLLHRTELLEKVIPEVRKGGAGMAWCGIL